MKKNAMRKVSVITVMSAMVMANTAMSFAASDNPQTVPAHINVPVTAIDFTITEKINMTGTADSHDLTVDSLAVTNNNEIGVLNIDSIAATAANGWMLVSGSTDFTKVAADARQFALVADGSHDMTSAYREAGTVDPGQTDTTAFTGKTGIVTAAVDDEKVADVVVTVSLV